MNMIFGGKVEKKDSREDGQFTIHVENSSALFRYRILCIICGDVALWVMLYCIMGDVVLLINTSKRLFMIDRVTFP
jgi:hypothetical protein